MDENKEVLPILQIYPGQISKRVLTCGDPWRAKNIASKLDNMEIVSEKREYWIYNGKYDEVDITVAAHGVGSAGAAICFEELIRAGAEVIIRVGTCGGLQDFVNAGDLIVGTGGVREDGVTQQLVPISYPAISDCVITQTLYEEAKKGEFNVWKGIVLTMGAFYKGILPLANSLMIEAGVVAMENEAATLLTIASLYGKRAGVILVADGKAFELEDNYRPNAAFVKKAVEEEIEVALRSIAKLSL